MSFRISPTLGYQTVVLQKLLLGLALELSNQTGIDVLVSSLELPPEDRYRRILDDDSISGLALLELLLGTLALGQDACQEQGTAYGHAQEGMQEQQRLIDRFLHEWA